MPRRSNEQYIRIVENGYAEALWQIYGTINRNSPHYSPAQQKSRQKNNYLTNIRLQYFRTYNVGKQPEQTYINYLKYLTEIYKLARVF